MTSIRYCVALIAALSLAACSPRATVDLKPEAAEVGTVKNILVATNRLPAEPPEVLSGRRSENLSYLSFAVSIPPDRSPGSVVFPGNSDPDPSQHFLTVSGERLVNDAAFRNEVNAQLLALPSGQREASVFVHGFNTNFAEGLYRHAQISHDFGSNAVSVNFSWPSAGSATRYATDRETALFVRGSLESVLNTLAQSRAERIIVVAHSMGAFIVMEALRQMDARNDTAFFNKIASVVLLAPDIDLDVFLKQAAPMEQRDVPIFVFTSGDDRALRISSRLRGGAIRLGALRDQALLGDLPIFLIDLSELTDGQDALLHSKAANSPTMISLVDGMGSAGLEMFRDEERRPSLLDAGIIAVQGAGDAVGGVAGFR